ncbi:sensor histidine kinase [Streptomyces massasporeus]|uniref:sensor histidine kinase n=1 Tax=Streptomyces massasporeus TaxID=67324 RepID=UPI003320B09A
MAAASAGYAADVMSGWWAVSAAGLACAAATAAVDRWATRTAGTLDSQRDEVAERTQRWLTYYGAMAVESDKNLRLALEQLARGETPPMPAMPSDVEAVKQDPWRELEATLRRSHMIAWQSVVGRRQANADLSQIFLNLAGGLFGLVVRALGIVTQREATVEDPDTMYDLLDVDSLLRRIRRHAARFAVLGGQLARAVDEPIRVLDLLRGAVAEVERYDQARIPTPKFDVQIASGGVGPDLIHLLAELIENATKYSAPQNEVTVKASEVQAGLLVEIEDRGLGLGSSQLRYFNRLLTSPQESDLAERLAEHQTGLLVVSRLAARYKVKVELRQNIFGGTTAYVVIPKALLQRPSPRHLSRGPNTAPAHRPAPRPSGGPRPTPPVTASGTAPLPRRRPQGTAPATDGQPSRDGTKPELPRRPQQPLAPQPQPAPVARTGTEPAPNVAPDFMANFTAGFERDEATASQPHTDGSSSGTDR